ncbi:NUDIX hydrolase [Novosphingobium olei]|uniref:NUDIX hydrolase n=1 Tax=Novosphingobium olei TaxID=2728851 RepID=UPI0030875154|nr:NUDIX domain-containing protein [Novosphingobium olei]
MSDDASQRRIRRAARILLSDAQGCVLLFRYSPPGRRAFWCAPGGECDPGEDFPAAARRELREETGLDIDCGSEIAARADDFVTLEGEPVRSDERFFRVEIETHDVVDHGRTELEVAMGMTHRWFTRDEIAGWPEPIFPENLLALLDLKVPA